MNKKGAELMMELVTSVIMLFVIITAMLFIQGSTVVNINSEVNAENAHYICNTNLRNFLRTKSPDGVTDYSSLIRRGYIAFDPSVFNESIKEVMAASLEDRWNMHIYSYSPARFLETDETGELTGYFASNLSRSEKSLLDENLELCYANIAVPCPLGNPSHCMVIVELEVEPNA